MLEDSGTLALSQVSDEQFRTTSASFVPTLQNLRGISWKHFPYLGRWS